MKKSKNNAFTLIELLVVISIIAILAGIALPVFSGVQTRGAQTKSLSNVKQIALALKLYAGDNDGKYPAKADGSTFADSNKAFAQLIPTYLQTEMPFYQPKSAFTPAAPDNKYDAAVSDAPTDTLKANENQYAYMGGMTETSNSRWPLMADGLNTLATALYTNIDTDKGGVWKGTVAIIANNDQSASLVKLSSTYAPMGVTSDSSSATDKKNLLLPGTTWLVGTTLVNPL